MCGPRQGFKSGFGGLEQELHGGSIGGMVHQVFVANHQPDLGSGSRDRFSPPGLTIEVGLYPGWIFVGTNKKLTFPLVVEGIAFQEG